MTEERHEGDIDRELDDPVFEELFAAMRATTRRPAPPMSPALTMLLAPGAVGRRRRARGATVGLAVVGVLAGGVGAAAATGHLSRPAPVTRVVEGPTDAGSPGPEESSDVVVPPSTHPSPTPDPGATDGDDRTTDAAEDDGDSTAPATRRPRATHEADGDDGPETGGSGSGDDRAEESEDPGQDDGSDDSGTEESGDDEHQGDGGSDDGTDDGTDGSGSEEQPSGSDVGGDGSGADG